MEKRQYMTEQKAKIFLEILAEEKGINEIAAREAISRSYLQNWKKECMGNSAWVISESKIQKVSGRTNAGSTGT